MLWMRRRWRIMIARGGRHDAGHVPSVRLRTSLVRIDDRFRAACPRRSFDRIPQHLQPNSDRNAGTLCVVSHAHVRLSRVAGGADLQRGALFCADSAGRAQCAMAASAGMVLRACHVLQRTRTYRGDDPGTHGCKRARRATGAGILFFATAFHRIGVADDAVVEDGFQISRSNPSVVLSSASWCEGLCSFLRQHRHCE